jgi:dTDP-glucose 4,6-dehydratase
MARLLVTGGAGFIGGNFVHYWRARHPGDEITVLDALTYAGNAETIGDAAGVSLIVGDIGDTALVETLLRGRAIDTLVNFAAESHVDRSIAAPDAFIQTNLVGTYSLLKAVQKVWLDEDGGKPHRFHHISSDEVYGSLGPDDAASTESSAYAPNSPYSAAKASADHLVRAWRRTYGLHATISTSSNNYGPYQFPEKIIPLFLANALSNKRLPIYGDGENRRDWLHVEDHCRGIELVLEQGRAGETYNLGGGAEMSNLELVAALCGWIDRAFAADPELAKRFPFAPAARGERTAILQHFVEDRKGHDRRYAIDAGKARDELGFAPLRSFGEGLGETLQWYLDHEEWWLPLLERGK